MADKRDVPSGAPGVIDPGQLDGPTIGYRISRNGKMEHRCFTSASPLSVKTAKELKRCGVHQM